MYFYDDDLDFADPTPAPMRDAASARAQSALEGLTPAQHEAVIHRGTPQLVLAGAGSGKTSVITRRIVHLIASGDAAPEEILGVTFTIKAAREISRRVEAMLGEDAFARAETDSPSDAARGRRRLRISLHTFHAAAYNLLNGNLEAAGLPSGFSILTGDDQLRIVKKVLADLITVKGSGGITADQAKAALADIEAVAGDPDSYEEMISAATPLLRKLMTGYNNAKRTMGALDFTDLMVRSLDLLRHDDEVAEYTRARWRHVLVDEYQDTNRVQEAWLREIVGDGSRLTVVGDDDQILYSWRGAEAGNILGFPDRYPGTRVIRLEENFRSVRNVLDCANGVIAPVKNRHGKTLIATRPNGRKVAVRRFLEATHEAAWVARTIEADLKAGVAPAEIAVLARASHALNLVEQALGLLRIPFQLSGGTRFQDRGEIRDALAWARLVANPADTAAFERAAQSPRRGLGSVSIERIMDSAKADDVLILDAARAFVNGDGLPAAQCRALATMLDVLDEASRAYWRSTSSGELLTFLIEESGIRASLEASMAEAEAEDDQQLADRLAGKLANLADLEKIAGDMTLDAFLEHMGVGDAGSTQEAEIGVFVGTAHAGKGLEWKRVILIGWEDNLFPDWRALGPVAPSPYASAGHPLDEERRIGYVMVTRARDVLDITTCGERFGKPARPSRFLSNLPATAAELWEMPAPRRA